jgi:hypothetical protein
MQQRRVLDRPSRSAGRYGGNIVDRLIRRRPQAARYHHSRGALRLGAARERRDRRQFPGHSDPGQRLFELAAEDLTKAINREDHSPAAPWSSPPKRLNSNEFSLCTSKFESDMPSHAVSLWGAFSGRISHPAQGLR